MTALLEEYIHRFFGYGSWNRPVWFLGMEEAEFQAIGGAAALSLNVRLRRWRARGCRELENAPEFVRCLGFGQYFPLPPPVPPVVPRAQPTWDKLTKIYLAARHDREPTNAEVRQFRINEFGQEDATRSFTPIELFPLPSPNIRDWRYGNLAGNLPCLINRDTYRHEVYADRATTLRRKIAIYKPKAVLCYGSVYRELVEGIIGTTFPAPNNAANVGHAHLGAVQFFSIRHVGALGMSNQQLKAIGQYIRQSLPLAVQGQL